MTIDYIFLLNDASIVINAEEYYMSVDYSMGNTDRDYHYEDIISCRINPDGSLAWARNINKKTEAAGNADNLSYSSFVLNGDVYFLMNAPVEIDKKRDGRLIIEQPDNAVYAFKIDATGNMSYKKIIKEDDLEETMFPRYATHLEEMNTILIRGGRGKKYQMAKITY